ACVRVKNDARAVVALTNHVVRDQDVARCRRAIGAAGSDLNPVSSSVLNIVGLVEQVVANGRAVPGHVDDVAPAVVYSVLFIELIRAFRLDATLEFTRKVDQKAAVMNVVSSERDSLAPGLHALLVSIPDFEPRNGDIVRRHVEALRVGGLGKIDD